MNPKKHKLIVGAMIVVAMALFTVTGAGAVQTYYGDASERTGQADGKFRRHPFCGPALDATTRTRYSALLT